MAGSIRTKRSLAPAASQPVTIVCAKVDSVEVNVASNPGTDGMIFEKIKEKERELVYQKVILEGCKGELATLRKHLENEAEPEQREELLRTARKFAFATAGKKEQVVASYESWKKSLADSVMLRNEETRE